LKSRLLFAAVFRFCVGLRKIRIVLLEHLILIPVTKLTGHGIVCAPREVRLNSIVFYRALVHIFVRSLCRIRHCGPPGPRMNSERPVRPSDVQPRFSF